MIHPAGLAALICALSWSVSAIAATPPAHSIQVRIEPETQQLEGSDQISFDAPRAATLLLSPRFRVDSLAVDAHSIAFQARIVGGLQHISVPPARRIDIRWSGKLAPLDSSLDHRDTLTYDEPASGKEGTFLPSDSGWYPQVEGALASYSVALDLPADQRGLVPGRLIEEREAQGRYRARFEFPHPAEGIALMAGPYRIDERRVRTADGSEVRLRTYFHPQIADLASDYLDSVEGYINMFDREIGPYPFSEFSVVSSPTPTGFGMPTLTYLGIAVLRLPFIRATSLGHEVLHDWWGNGVYVDYARGNWCEGLTTFMADYAFREREGPQAAFAMRLAWLSDYAAMPRAEDMPLDHFTERSHGATQIIGYNKSAMLFFMLRDEIGKAAFYQALRNFWKSYRFRIASWSDLRGAFERASGKDLSTFFAQWLQRTGAPDLRIADAKAKQIAGGWQLSVTLTQGSPAYALSVPLAVRTGSGEITRRVPLTHERGTAALELPSKPLAVVLDPQLRLWRQLGPGEAPPILRDAMLAERPALIIPTADTAVQAAARKLASNMLEGVDTASADASALLVVGLHADIDAWLAREKMPPRPAMLAPEHGSAQVWTERAHGGRVAVIVSVRDAASLAALARPLPHYGRESWLVFDGAHMLKRGTWPSQPQVWRLVWPTIHQ
jgi:aminopeptidase N